MSSSGEFLCLMAMWALHIDFFRDRMYNENEVGIGPPFKTKVMEELIRTR